MTTVNPIVNPQVSTAFKGKSKKAFDALKILKLSMILFLKVTMNFLPKTKIF